MALWLLDQDSVSGILRPALSVCWPVSDILFEDPLMMLRFWAARQQGRAPDVPAPARPRQAGPAAPTMFVDYRPLLRDRLEHLLGLSRTEADTLTIQLMLRTVEEERLELPRLPALALQLMSLDPDGPANGEQIAALIAQDRDVTACVMETANRRGAAVVPVRSVQQAIVRLGFSMVQLIAAGASAHKVIYKIPGYNDEARVLADRALVCARVSHRLARPLRVDPGDAFLSGLFHDVGQVLVLRALSQVRAKTQGARASRLLIRRLNQQLHVPLGAWFAETRGLSEEVRDAITYHHEPCDALSGLVWGIQALQAGPRPHGDDWLACAPPMAEVQAALSAATA